jgi:hypothetical protein
MQQTPTAIILATTTNLFVVDFIFFSRVEFRGSRAQVIAGFAFHRGQNASGKDKGQRKRGLNLPDTTNRLQCSAYKLC